MLSGIISSNSYKLDDSSSLDIRNRLSKEQKKRIESLRQIDPSVSILQYVKVYCSIVIAIAIGIHWWNPLVIAAVVVFIAGRQHSLYILNHDASHNLLFKTCGSNKWAATIFSNLVMFHHPEAWSFVQWKRIHMRHHAYLFTDRDPNYIGRQEIGDTTTVHGPLKLIGLCIRSGFTSSIQFFTGRQDYVGPRATDVVRKGACNHLWCLFKLFKDDPEMALESRIRLAFIVAAGVIITYCQWWVPFIVFWIVPMYTVYPMLLTFMDLTEHCWTDRSGRLSSNTRSVRANILVQFVLSTLPRGFHREHHLYPRVAVTRLPQLSAILCESQGISEPISLKDLFQELTRLSQAQKYNLEQSE